MCRSAHCFFTFSRASEQPIHVTAIAHSRTSPGVQPSTEQAAWHWRLAVVVVETRRVQRGDDGAERAIAARRAIRKESRAIDMTRRGCGPDNVNGQGGNSWRAVIRGEREGRAGSTSRESRRAEAEDKNGGPK